MNCNISKESKVVNRKLRFNERGQRKTKKCGEGDVVPPSIEHINLKVLGQDGSVIQFKIKTRTPLRKLMRAYCLRVGLAKEIARFRFDGQPISEADTPSRLEMEDGDTIEVYTQQTGGSCSNDILSEKLSAVFFNYGRVSEWHR
ncbi:hypothetical protein J437_LFUL013183 [Ladona fulva]|uniref:Ubiquitin-like domain-containing protein n=1 Tax=Ladona fulva TaxID=123851 RepID=A0A8K0KDI8_LADFU|nr:hypothetical protein J437_LFUL013183 [Ladona fulva]